MQQHFSVSSMLKIGITAFQEMATARLDAEILLAHALRIPRTKLYTESSQIVIKAEQKKYMEYVEERLQGVPIPYITGSSEFWSLTINVTKDVLIPRPESELLVEIALELSRPAQETLRVMDLGTGSGAIAAAYAKENPSAMIMALDISASALAVAQKNFQKLSLSQINLINSHWLNAICKNSLDIIIANPPYIGASDACFTSKSISFEPEIALYANNEGMSAIEALTLAGSDCLKPGGFLLIEHGFAQKKQVISCFLENNFINVITRTDLAGHDRVTYGQKF